MYTQFGSPAWIFDRCQEVGYYSWVIFILVAVLAALAGWWLVRKQLSQEKGWRSKMVFLAVPISMAIVSLPLTFIGLIIGGFFVVKCYAADQFWPGVNTGHEIHAKIKEARLQGKTPKNEAELEQLAPQFMAQLKEQARYSYTYDPYQDRYTLMVRPSQYAVAIYDPELTPQSDYQLYVLSPVSNFAQEQPTFPPTSTGPWGKVPKN